MSWEHKASCKGKHELFEIIGRGDPRAKEMKGRQLVNTNVKHFYQAAEICETCPVKLECAVAAEPEDFDNTFRAGNWPSGFEHHDPAYIAKRVCKRGHVGEYAIYGPSRYFCRACVRDKAREKNRAKGVPARAGQESCARGHRSWGYTKTQKYCLICHRDAARKSAKRRRENAKMGG